MTPKQTAFVQEYLVDLCATAAARRAGYSERRAAEIGYQLLQKTTVAAAIHAAQAKREKRTEIKADDVLRRLATEMDGEGPDTTSSARIRAAELLGKHLGILKDKIEIDPGDKWLRVREALRQRAKRATGA